ERMKMDWEFQGDLTLEAGLDAFKSYKKASHKPRAIFSCNDAMSQAFIEAAIKEGYQFPDDIAIIGFGDLPIRKWYQSTISSITTSYNDLGQITIEALGKNIFYPKKQQGMLTLVPVSLTQRESS